MADQYGTDLAISDAGDLIVWPNGELATYSGPDTCIQALRFRVLTMRGELPLHPEAGSGFPKLVGTRNLELLLSEANQELRTLLEEDPRFLSAKDLKVTYANDRDPRAAVVSLKLGLAGGDQLQVADLTVPQVDEVLAPEFVDAADLDQLQASEDFDFSAQSDDEFAELADFIETADALASTPKGE